jgi:glutathione S-transferase
MSSGITATLVDLMQGAQMKNEYLVINPNHAVPSYREGDDFLLTESSTILKYIARKFDSPCYPKDLKARARVDQVRLFPEYDPRH